MKYYSYDVEPIFVTSDGGLSWKITGNGSYIIGIKGGQKYFIKKRTDPIYPNPSLSKAAQDYLLQQILPIAKKQKELQKRMSGLDTFKDHIVVEVELIEGDMERRFVTITHMIEDGLGEKYDYSKLSQTDFLALAKEMSTDLCKLHKVEVIHSDLKPKNFVFQKSGANIIPYLIDFDSSYPFDLLPNRIPGSPGYFPPESLVINDKADELEERGEDDLIKDLDKSNISSKVDVFSLAIVYHVLWAGVFPNYDVKYDSVGDALKNGDTVTISSKFNVKIGPTNGATFKSLLNWMIAKDPSQRPTMDEVLDVLSDKARVPSEFHIGDDVLNIRPILWQEDILITEEFSAKSLEASGIDEFYPSTKMEGEKTIKLYTIKLKGDPNLYNLTIDELFDKGILKKVASKYDEPFDEDNATFISEEELRALGINSIERFKEPKTNRNRYRITQRSMIYAKGIRSLIQMGIAKEKEIKSSLDSGLFEEPYTKGYVYNEKRIAESKIKSIKHAKTSGNYIVTWETRGDLELPERMVISMGFLVKKV